MKRDAVAVARGTAAGLAAADLAFGVLLARRSRLLDWLLGPSEGIWRFWGIGDLFGYAAAQAAIAARPTPGNLRALAMLRGQLVPADAMRALRAPDKRGQSVLIGLFNAGTAMVAWRASTRLT